MTHKYTREEAYKKLKNILKKADPSKNPSEHEVQLALKIAQKFALEYHLDMAGISSDDEAKPSDIITVALDLRTKSVPSWASMLVNIVAQNHNVVCYLSNSQIMLMGLPDMVEVAKITSEYVIDSAKALWKRHLATIETRNRSESLAHRNDYMQGFRKGLRDAYKENVESHALVLVKPQALVVREEQLHLRKGATAHLIHAGSDSSYQAGVKDGKSTGAYKTEARRRIE